MGQGLVSLGKVLLGHNKHCRYKTLVPSQVTSAAQVKRTASAQDPLTAKVSAKIVYTFSLERNIVWGELACHKRLFNPPPQFSRLGTWCPAFVCVCMCMCVCVCVCVCLVVCLVFGWRVCVWWFGGEINRILFYIASMLCTWFFMSNAGSKCWLMLMASGCLIVIAPLCGLIILSGISYHNQIPPGERACAQYEILTTEAVLCGAGDLCTAGGINTSVHTVDGYSANQPITSWLVRKEDLEFYTKQEEPTSFNETLRASDVILGYRNPKYLWTESVISGKCCISNEMETTGTSTLELFPSLQSAFHLSENKPVYEETITLSANSSMCFQNWGPGKPFTVKENGYHFFVLSSNTTVKYIFEMTVTQVFVNATDYKDPNYFTSNNHSIFSFEKCSENGVTKTQVSYVTLCQATE